MTLIRRTAGIWGPAAFCGAAVVAARRQADYSHRSQHVSGLAALDERSARVMVPGFVALGASGLLMPTPDATLTRLARVAGTTTIAAGLVRVSAPSCPRPGSDPAATPSDAGHGIASVATFALWTAMPILAGRQAGPRWYRLSSAVLGTAAVGAVVAAGTTTQIDSPHKGLVQRGFLAIIFTWHVVTAIMTLTRPG